MNPLEVMKSAFANVPMQIALQRPSMLKHFSTTTEDPRDFHMAGTISVDALTLSSKDECQQKIFDVKTANPLAYVFSGYIDYVASCWWSVIRMDDQLHSFYDEVYVVD